MYERYKKLIWALVALLILATVAWFGVDLWFKQTRATLIIDGAPDDMVMTINNKKISHPHKLYVTPGDYSLSFSRPEFSIYNKKLSLVKAKTSVIEVALHPTTDKGRAYLSSHPAVARQLERVGGLIYKQQVADLTKRYPLITKLPVNVAVGGYGEFSINYKSETLANGDLAPVIIIGYPNDTTKERALKWIKDHGYNLADYKIEFVSSLPSNNID